MGDIMFFLFLNAFVNKIIILIIKTNFFRYLICIKLMINYENIKQI